MIYFIPSSEFNAYLKQIKVVLSAVKKYRIFFTSDEYDLYFFTVANRGCFDNLGLNFFPEKMWNALFLSDITLRKYARRIKYMTSHFTSLLSLRNGNAHATSI